MSGPPPVDDPAGPPTDQPTDKGRRVTYDREEWRRPWRAEQPPPGRADPGSPVAAEALAPVARFPQAPPAAWDDRASGPGSPAGSVRPPDTTATVDAPERRRRGRGPLGWLLASVFGAALGTAATLAILLPAMEEEPAAVEPAPTADASAPTIEIEGGLPSVVPAVASAVAPSVVQIDVVGVDGPMGAQPSLGSGVIYRSDGYVLTNHHVVSGADEVRVRFASGDIVEATVVGSDQLNDLAVVLVDRSGLPAINLRPGDEPLIVGETVVAIGSPFGLTGSVTTGIVSALNRDLAVDEEDGAALVIPSVIQTDAAINPGNSGGALVDAQGRLIGINTAILSRTGANQGVGFAVPAEQAIGSADQLIEQGFVRHPLLGISGIDVSPELAEEFGLEASRGAVVDAVQEGTGAAAAGLRAGDIIVAVDDQPLATMGDLVAEVRRRQPGEVVVLSIVRNGAELDVEVELGERPRG